MATISGIVTISDTETPGAATVLLLNAEGDTILDSTVSDPVTGEYEFNGVAAGPYRLIVMGGGTYRSRIYGPCYPDLWTPDDLSAPPKVWLNDDSGVTGASTMSQWDDISPSGFHFVQATSGSRPQVVASGLNSRRIARFDGSNDFMSAASASSRDLMRNVQAGYLFAVVKKNSIDGVATDRTLFRVNTGGGSARFAVQIGSTLAGANKPEFSVRRADGDSLSWLGGSSALGSGFHILLFTMNWGTRAGAIYVDGEVDASDETLTPAVGSTSDTASNESPHLGKDVAVGTRYLDCDLAELIVGSGSALPSSDEIDKLFGYAAHRWGLASNLPVDHPYKDAPP